MLRDNPNSRAIFRMLWPCAKRTCIPVPFQHARFRAVLFKVSDYVLTHSTTNGHRYSLRSLPRHFTIFYLNRLANKHLRVGVAIFFIGSGARLEAPQPTI